MKHTKGPWHIGTACGIQLEGKFVGDPTYSVFGNDATPDRGPSSLAHAKIEDARLIAAAPELLEALNKIIQNIEDAQCRSLDDFKDLVAMAHDVSMKAIAKAEGES